MPRDWRSEARPLESRPSLLPRSPASSISGVGALPQADRDLAWATLVDDLGHVTVEEQRAGLDPEELATAMTSTSSSQGQSSKSLGRSSVAAASITRSLSAPCTRCHGLPRGGGPGRHGSGGRRVTPLPATLSPLDSGEPLGGYHDGYHDAGHAIAPAVLRRDRLTAYHAWARLNRRRWLDVGRQRRSRMGDSPALVTRGERLGTLSPYVPPAGALCV